LQPGDAHVLSIGIHVALGVERTPPPVEVSLAPSPEPAVPPPPLPPPPPPDRDHDGIADAEDACPDIPGVPSQDPAKNGCPPPGDAVRVVETHIDYDEVIHFDTDRAHVHHASWPILQKLAVFISAHPDIEVVDISGHADERGTEAYNLQLSKARAEAVKELLVRFGVDSARLTTQAYGFSHPRSAGHTENDWRENRRVEFLITRVRNPQGGSTSLPAGAQGEHR
ncbi:MAG: OmpA family protein, partial [Myxococcota bacterium]|nr:OmpA family protein [Myxococcota bacterium]